MLEINNLGDRLAMNLPEYLTPSNGDSGYIEKYLPDNLKKIGKHYLKEGFCFFRALISWNFIGLTW